MRRRRLFALALPLTLTASLTLGCGSDDGSGGAAPESVEWSYSGESGPERWGELSDEYAACGEGSHQSPIDLHTGDAGAGANASFEYGPVEADVVDTGHSVEYELDGGGAIELNGRSYELLQARFHAPAEHLVDGERRPIELQLAHQSRRGDLAVVAVAAEEGPASTALQPFVDAVAGAGADPEPVGELDPSGLLPDRGEDGLTAFSYLGSLTTPPCTEDVRWLVVDEPVTLSSEQLRAFTDAYEGNSRPAQDLSGREPLRASLRPTD
jgi:carbonic anhydrase